jgi:SMC interacting uncharacterized protein involved in chromosome segregation
MEELKLQITNLEKLILEKFAEIDKKLDSLIENNKEITTECKKMGSHINFIEDTYNVLQTPLNYVKKSVERLMGSSSSDLKNLPIKDTEI